MDWTSFGQVFLDNIIVPITLILGSTIVGIVKVLGDRVTKSIIAKNEIESLERITATKTNILSELSTIVDAAVASNMRLANKMKENGQKLNDEQILELNESAKLLISNAISPSLSENDGVLLNLFGGQDKLDSIIDSLMEKFVIEEKMKFPQRQSVDPKPAAPRSVERSLGIVRRPPVG